MKHRHLHKRFLVPNARRGTDPKILGYADRPSRPVADATGVDQGGRDVAADSAETVAQVAGATRMCDEPECIGEAIISYAETNRKYDTMRRAREIEEAREVRQGMSEQQRLQAIRGRAKQQRVSVSGEVRLVEHMLARAATGGRRAPDAALRKLEALEAKLDGAANVERLLDEAA